MKVDAACFTCPVCGWTRTGGPRAIPWAAMSARERRRWRLEREGGLRAACAECIAGMLARGAR